MIQVPYQNKDVLSKFFAERLKEKSLAVYGVDIPKVKELLPTNLPALEVNELRLDNLFLLEDQSLLLLDYESDYSTEDLLSYAVYAVRILKRYGKRWSSVQLRILILYTSDITRANASFDVGCMQFRIEQAFLGELDTKKIYWEITSAIDQGRMLTGEEQLQLIVLPLTVKGREVQLKWLKRSIALAKQIPDEETRSFVLAGLLAFSDKVATNELLEEIKGELRMLRIERMIYEEGMADGQKQGMAQGIQAVILDNLEENIDKERILEKLERLFSLSPERAAEYYKQFAG